MEPIPRGLSLSHPPGSALEGGVGFFDEYNDEGWSERLCLISCPRLLDDSERVGWDSSDGLTSIYSAQGGHPRPKLANLRLQSDIASRHILLLDPESLNSLFFRNLVSHHEDQYRKKVIMSVTCVPVPVASSRRAAFDSTFSILCLT